MLLGRSLHWSESKKGNFQVICCAAKQSSTVVKVKYTSCLLLMIMTVELKVTDFFSLSCSREVWEKARYKLGPASLFIHIIIWLNYEADR